MLTRRALLQTAAAAALLPACKVAPSFAQAQHLGFLGTTAAAEAGFIYGLPIVMSYAVMHEEAIDRRSGRFKAPLNEITHEYRTAASRRSGAIFPHDDTLDSVAWMDLRREPLVLSVPAVESQRYYSVMLRDGNFYTYGYIGSRTTGNEAGVHLVVGPGWTGETPPDIKKVFRSSTEFSLALFRTQLLSAGDVENVRRIQDGYRLTPLSTYRQESPPAAASTVQFRTVRKKSLRKNFFQNLAFALQFTPAQFIEADARAKLARLGVGPGKTFDFKDLSLKRRLEITLGIKAADRKIDRAISETDVTMNGWRIASYFGDSAFYDGNWLLRAAASKADFYGNAPEEAVLALAAVDGDGAKLDGRHGYTLTFASGQLPPVHAFWSLTAYDRTTRSMVNNSIGRRRVNSMMVPTMRTNADGGLTIYIQREPPPADATANWLRAPEGSMLLAMRLYWPKAEPPSVLPVGKGTWRPPGLSRAS